MLDGSQLQDFMPFITGALGGATSAGVFAGPIQTLQDWWYINFGHSISNQAALLRATQEANVEKLKNDILSEVVKIPSENIQNPNLKIIGPALEASRYYIEEEELRNMFSKIISSSFDNRKNGIIHSSFVEVIKQLDVLDAQILQFLNRNGYSKFAPAPAMKMFLKDGEGTKTLFHLIFLAEELFDFQRNAASIINLERLGIVSIKDDAWLTDETKYDFIKDHPVVTHLLEHNQGFELGKLCFVITVFGQNFIDSCVSQ